MLRSWRDMPCTSRARVGIALVMRIHATIVALETAISLDPAPEIERAIAPVRLHGELYILRGRNGATEVAVALQRGIDGKVAANVALPGGLLDG